MLSKTWSQTIRVVLLLLGVLALAGCEPEDRRPGLWLRGDVSRFPADMAFTDEHEEIAIEVQAPYGLPHSVTIWCARVDDQLYIAAADPDSKWWPGWVEARPELRLKLGHRLFEGRLVRLKEEAEIAAVRRAYIAKYDLDPSRASPGLSHYWRVEPRSRVSPSSI